MALAREAGRHASASLGPVRRGPGCQALLVFAAVALALAGSACARTKTQSGLTGVDLTVRYDRDQGLDGLLIAGHTDAGGTLTPGRLPDPPRPLRSGIETATVLVPSTFAGQTLFLRVDGLVGDTVVASAVQTVAIRAAARVPAEVTLGAPAVCGDGAVRDGIEECDDGNVMSGDGCSAECMSESQGACGLETCFNGCCSNGMCRSRALATCGIAGAACGTCDPAEADTCSETGTCRCGSGAPCGDGQECALGACVCNPSSCPSGCCQGNLCLPTTANSCGVSGARCVACDRMKADGCDASGACSCGTGAACASGQQCVAGLCVCNAASCASGCCQNNACSTRSLATCGNAGATCTKCDDRADNCSGQGACRCGTGQVCANGQRCVGGSCMCDGTSCPSGCCSNGACLLGDTPDSCGTGGLRCDACPSGQSCVNGRCSGCNATSCSTGCCSGATCNPSALATCAAPGNLCVGCDSRRADGCAPSGQCACGDGPQCSPGSRCVNGSCVCRPASCPSGCCSGDVCVQPALASCGSAGGECSECSQLTSDTCTAAGTCGCGAGPACGTHQHCVGGKCVCDALSCNPGCCDGNMCRMSGLAMCGKGGVACHDCGMKADTCSSTGVCQCGGGAACADGSRCVGGKCVCDGTSCATGCCLGTSCLQGTDAAACGSAGAQCQDCQGGTCNGGVCSGCTPALCPDGCCSGPNCVSPSSTTACGVGGAACVTCDNMRADACSSVGRCTCGGQPACGAGMRCVSGACVCDALSCPNGCCANNTCTVPSFDACAVGGNACNACPSRAADKCDRATGTCLCGNDAPCPTGSVCESGACVCNGTTCPGGCCSKGTCFPPTATACGIGGETCLPCDATEANKCAADGTCACGDNSPCAAGSHCNAGNCEPDA